MRATLRAQIDYGFYEAKTRSVASASGVDLQGRHDRRASIAAQQATAPRQGRGPRRDGPAYGPRPSHRPRPVAELLPLSRPGRREHPGVLTMPEFPVESSTASRPPGRSGAARGYGHRVRRLRHPGPRARLVTTPDRVRAYRDDPLHQRGERSGSTLPDRPLTKKLPRPQGSARVSRIGIAKSSRACHVRALRCRRTSHVRPCASRCTSCR